MMKTLNKYMKAALVPAALALLSLVENSTAAEMVLKKGDRVAIVGDSITEQKLYSKYIELYLTACVPQLELKTFQFGWSGERAPGFAKRMENDMFPWKPTVVTSCFGMNDGGYAPYKEEIGKIYEDGTRSIQSRCKELGILFIEGGPGAVDTETWNKATPEADRFYNDNLAQLSAIAKRLADGNGFEYAGLHPLMIQVMKAAKAGLGNDYHVCGGDGVHPAANGHLVMAYGFLKAMELDGSIGTISVDLSGKTTATEGHRILSAKDGTIEIESTRYPFCFTGDGKNPGGNRSILPFLPFNKDLNRYVLVVKNLPTANAAVTWGSATNTFSKAELEAGVNLAEAFPENPFSAPFAELDGLVAKKQAGETRMIKGLITHLRGYIAEYPDDKELQVAFETLRQKLFDTNARESAKVRAGVKPVTHVIKILPN